MVEGTDHKFCPSLGEKPVNNLMESGVKLQEAASVSVSASASSMSSNRKFSRQHLYTPQVTDIQYTQGSEYADTIKTISQALNNRMVGKDSKVGTHLSKRVYASTKSLFWEEDRYNPLLKTSHICHVYDAHQKEQERYWAKSGSKFSEEPRFGPPPGKKIGDGRLESGYLIPAEIPKFNEKEVRYFERPMTTKKISRIPKRELMNKPKKPTPEEETAHLGPGCYKLSDPWQKNLEPVCGIVRPTSSFARLYKNECRSKKPTSSYVERASSPVARESERRGRGYQSDSNGPKTNSQQSSGFSTRYITVFPIKSLIRVQLFDQLDLILTLT